MARATEKKATASLYPSEYGSHRVMIDQAATDALNQPGRVVLRDEKGLYETDTNRLDCGLADPNRHSYSRPDERDTKKKDEKK